MIWLLSFTTLARAVLSCSFPALALTHLSPLFVGVPSGRAGGLASVLAKRGVALSRKLCRQGLQRQNLFVRDQAATHCLRQVRPDHVLEPRFEGRDPHRGVGAEGVDPRFSAV